ncbi:hypothetical protein M2651_11410 [Clostridium sp. SYSU_GA19001]|uniref:hypothetical protein n=1 Tax=Clostridium caldaquaticum TaxID=2940653 RepID=UPI0020777093|nr:hypothetical protein [Clostridium caldaquaticum]MCM8711622.1 hypothetical protein [Clostridium caldaquaticum]
MKSFETLIDETTKSEDIEELESAADLFQYGIEEGYYTKRQADEFNNVYWKTKNKLLAYEISDTVKANILDLISIISSAPNSLKDNKSQLIDYVNGRLKALKGKVSGLK